MLRTLQRCSCMGTETSGHHRPYRRRKNHHYHYVKLLGGPEEQKRVPHNLYSTIQAASVNFDWKCGNTVPGSDNVYTFNLIDTPGHVRPTQHYNTAEVKRSLRVLDGGVVIFSARRCRECLTVSKAAIDRLQQIPTHPLFSLTYET